MAKGDHREPVADQANRPLRIAENLVYVLAAVLLVVAAFMVLVATGYELVKHLSDGTEEAVTTALDGLLLVFILLELLAGVRATMTQRKLVAEPFLMVGIIASIKEILVVALEAQSTRGSQGDAFDDAMMELGVLGGLVLLLALASFLVRLKEREPEETDAS